MRLNQLISLNVIVTVVEFFVVLIKPICISIDNETFCSVIFVRIWVFINLQILIIIKISSLRLNTSNWWNCLNWLLLLQRMSKILRYSDRIHLVIISYIYFVFVFYLMFADLVNVAHLKWLICSLVIIYFLVSELFLDFFMLWITWSLWILFLVCIFLSFIICFSFYVYLLLPI